MDVLALSMGKPSEKKEMRKSQMGQFSISNIVFNQTFHQYSKGNGRESC